VKAAGARRDPQLARGAMAVDHHARAILELDLEHAAIFALDVGVDPGRFERRFDARTRPWFQGAMALASDDDIFWTDPYEHFHRKEAGLTTAKRWTNPHGGAKLVVSVDLLRRSVAVQLDCTLLEAA